MDEAEQDRNARLETDEQLFGQTAEAGPGPGQRLIEAREQRGLSRESVAASLRLTVSTVEQLEEDRYDALPPTIFARGYLKTYAALLEIDPEPLLSSFDQAIDVPVDYPLRVSGPIQTAPDMSRGMRRIMPGALMVIAIVAAGFWSVEAYRGMAPSVGPVVNAESEAEAEAEPEILTANAHPSWESDQGLGLPIAEEMLPDVVEPDPETRFTEELAGPAEGPVDDAGGDDNPVHRVANETFAEPVPTIAVPFGTDRELMADSNGTLVLSFTGPSWVEVYDADGERLLYGLIDANEQQTLSGVAPYSLVIGDTNHVSVEHAGEAVDLGARRPGRVARLQVPR